jgi:hypothetical protein
VPQGIRIFTKLPSGTLIRILHGGVSKLLLQLNTSQLPSFFRITISVLRPIVYRVLCLVTLSTRSIESARQIGMPYSRPPAPFLSPWRLLLLSTTACLLQGAKAIRIFESNSLNACMENSSFTASRFHVAYTPGNNTITFDINGYSQETSHVVLDVEVIGYGYSVTHPIINPCESKGLAGLCPLNSGAIPFRGNAPAPADAVNKIPGAHCDSGSVE